MTTHTWIEGDTIEAPCPRCADWVEATYEYGSIRLEQTGIDVPNVLVAVCNTCKETLGIPDQEAHKLKLARERTASERVAVKIPQSLDDIIYRLADRFDVDPKDFISPLVRYYSAQIDTGPTELRTRIKKLSRDRIATTGKKKKQATIRMKSDLLKRVMADMHPLRTSDIVRGIVMIAKEDVLDAESPQRTRDLHMIAEAVS